MLNSLFSAFLITEIAEVLVGLLFGFRKANQLAVIFAVNLITNPALNYVIWSAWYFFGKAINYPVLILLEAVIVLCEWGLLIFALPEEGKRKLFIFSLVANSASFGAGILLL